MLLWSKYNRLFQNSQYGYFLYNTLSNSFFELDQSHFEVLSELKKEGFVSENAIDFNFYSILREKKVFVAENENENILKTKQQNRDKFTYDKSNLVLTICPTLGCNFRCSYCFENDQLNGKKMKDDVINQIIEFIKTFKEATSLSVCWFGGEPTLVFDVVIKLTDKIKSLPIDFKDASIITNGYLLTADKIEKLNDLNIKNVQITIDGLKEAHDARRFLAGGRPTYDKIISNIENLMNSEYEGSCSIRVNIDKSNVGEYLKLREVLLNKFKDKKVTVYAGRVEILDNKSCSSCSLNFHEWTDFSIELYRNNSYAPGEHIFPDGNIENLCSANTDNSFVIGHSGELYKCWEDVGKEKMVVGNIFESKPITNPELIYRYNEGTNPYLDKECLNCSFLPICGGGCANRRLRDKFMNEGGMEYCSLYKDNLEKYLMEYYDGLITKEFYLALTDESFVVKNNGYRLINPNLKPTEEKISCA